MSTTARRYEVRLTRGARDDLQAIYRYIAESDSPASADNVLDALMKEVEGLRTFPDRGAYPPELLALGMRQCRQVRFKPYRMIYEVVGGQVFIHMIVDGRRDLQFLLLRRLAAR